MTPPSIRHTTQFTRCPLRKHPVSLDLNTAFGAFVDMNNCPIHRQPLGFISEHPETIPEIKQVFPPRFIFFKCGIMTVLGDQEMHHFMVDNSLKDEYPALFEGDRIDRYHQSVLRFLCFTIASPAIQRQVSPLDP